MLNEIMQYAIPILLTLLLGIISKFLLPALRAWIRIKTAAAAAAAKTAKAREMIYRIGDLIDECVMATNQNYVEGLKGTDAWTKEAQQIALRKTTAAVMRLITLEAKEILFDAFTDGEAWIQTKIDSSVNANKVKVE